MVVLFNRNYWWSGAEVLEITSASGTAAWLQMTLTIVAVDTIKLLGGVATPSLGSSTSYTHVFYDSYTVDASALGAAATIIATEETNGKLTHW